MRNTFALTTKLLLAVAAIAPSFSSATEAIVDPSSGDSSNLDSSSSSSSNLFSTTTFNPTEFLQTNSPTLILSASFPTSDLHAAFSNWSIEFQREYASVEEHALRKLIWLQNHNYITAHNNNNGNVGASGSSSFSLGHNDYSDITNDEFHQRFYLGKYSPGVVKGRGMSDGSAFGYSASSAERKLLLRSSSNNVNVNVDEIMLEETDEEVDSDSDESSATVDNVPDFKDWKEDGAVTKVKNQWFCGACWAFSAVGAIEGARYINTGNLTELSIQQLIDCDKTDLGCGGGLMDQAFGYDDTNSPGLCSLDAYPFAYHRHWFYGCSRYMPYCDPLPNSKVDKFVDVDKTEEALKAAIATQPVSVAVAAGPYDWQFYSGGVFDKGCEDPDGIDHGVLAVGYGSVDDASSDAGGGDGSDYWLVKNSWGESWGVNGFIQLARGSGNEAEGGSSCVLTMASRPIMKKVD